MTSPAPGTLRHPSVVVQVSRLPQDGLTVRFEADEAERRAVAGRFEIEGVERFEAELVAKRWQRDGVTVEGELSADVVQLDVVSLEPVPQTIVEEVRLFFVPEHSPLARETAAEEVEVDLAEDVPETFRGDRIDISEPLTQILGLALDPYPRRAGSEFAEVREGEKEPSPFAVLATLRNKKDM